MRAIKIPVIGVTILALLYLLTPWLGANGTVVGLLFVVTSGMTIWMVTRILKDGTPAETTFDDQWYEDKPRP